VRSLVHATQDNPTIGIIDVSMASTSPIEFTTFGASSVARNSLILLSRSTAPQSDDRPILAERDNLPAAVAEPENVLIDAQHDEIRVPQGRRQPALQRQCHLDLQRRLPIHPASAQDASQGFCWLRLQGIHARGIIQLNRGSFGPDDIAEANDVGS
jgi:hypothetical protein